MLGMNEALAAREAEGRPVRVGLIGAGQMGTDVVATTTMMQGIRVLAVADIALDRACDAFSIAGVDAEIAVVETAAAADEAIATGKRVATDDYRIITDMTSVEVLLEATGAPEVSAAATLQAVHQGKHIAMMSVETDVTVGPILSWYAEVKGVVYALAAGDEPAACKELYDFAEALGFTIVVAGKGKNNPLDRSARPDDPQLMQEAARRGLNPNMLVEFIDGSKTMIEMAAISNATGLVPDVRGMHGPLTDRDHLHETFALREDGGILSEMGVVDYGVGRVAPGVFLVVRTDHVRLREAMVLRDMGEGPYYTLFRPYHLCSIEVPLTCALLALERRANMRPLPHLVSEVFAVAKQDLDPGEILEGIGGSSFYSMIDRYEVARAEKLLPVGLAKGARVLKRIAAGSPITWDDVTPAEPSVVLALRRLQDAWMAGDIDEEALLIEVEGMIDPQPEAA